MTLREWQRLTCGDLITSPVYGDHVFHSFGPAKQWGERDAHVMRHPANKRMHGVRLIRGWERDDWQLAGSVEAQLAEPGNEARVRYERMTDAENQQEALI